MDIFENFKVFVSGKLKVKQRTLNTDTNEISKRRQLLSISIREIICNYLNKGDSSG